MEKTVWLKNKITGDFGRQMELLDAIASVGKIKNVDVYKILSSKEKYKELEKRCEMANPPFYDTFNDLRKLCQMGYLEGSIIDTSPHTITEKGWQQISKGYKPNLIDKLNFLC